MKSLKKKILTYTVIFEPAEEGGFIASVPALPGCLTQGDSYEETIKMIKDAICGYLTVLNVNKNEVPLEKQETIITKVKVPYPVCLS